MMTGCQKEQGSVTLKAFISQDSKAHLGTGNYPFWDAGDAINVNGQTYSLISPTETYATISGVPHSSTYNAVYPSRIVNSMADGSASVTLLTNQIYTTVGSGHQRLDMPMAATTTGDTLYFKNLCSIIRVNVVNSQSVDLAVKRIIVTVDGINICGNATVTFGETPALVFPNSEVNHTVLLRGTSDYNAMVTIPTGNNNNHEFDIIVPPFNNKTVYIRVETIEANGSNKHYEVKVQNAVLGRSKIVPITLTVSGDNPPIPNGPAILKPGPEVNAILKHYDATGVTVRTQTPPPTSGVYSRIDLENGNCTPIYAFVQSNSLIITTEADCIYANADCSHMFDGINGTTMNNSFGTTFKTDYVTDMSYMFANCTTLTHVGNLNTFVTTNVETMAHMFEGDIALSQLIFSPQTSNSSLTDMEGMCNGCTRLREVDMTNFTTSSVTNMADLFNGCVSLGSLHIDNYDMNSVTNKTNMCYGLGEGDADVGIIGHNSNNYVSIYCSEDVENAISSGTGLNTDIVVFNPPQAK